MVNCEYDTREKTDVIQVDFIKTIIHKGIKRNKYKKNKKLSN